ncbi:MAG TPA: hypothetical protein VIH90_08495, partial [Candidatus Saccharimonadales bacterium]
VNTAGALSGVTGYAQASGNFLQSGAGTFGTGSGAVSLNGATTVTGSNTFSTGTGVVSLNGNTTVTGSNTFSVGTGATLLGGTLGVAGLSSLNGGATIAGLTVNTSAQINTDATITGVLNVQGSNITVGNPGSATGSLILANNSSASTVSLQGLNPSGAGNATIQLPSIPGGTTDTVCLFTLANCGASAGTITYSTVGTANTLAKFTGGSTIANSGITDNGSTVSISELLSTNTISANTIQSSGALNITPGGTLTIGASSQTLSLQGSAAATSITVSSSGNTSVLSFVPPTANRTIQFPDESGILCIRNSTNCGFATGGSGVTSLNGISGALSVASATGSGTTITINNAKADGSSLGLATFNNSDFVDNGSGVIDTIQGITTSSSVQFGSLNLGVGDLTLSAIGAVLHVTNITNQSSSSNIVIDAGTQNVTFKSGANSFIFPTSGGTGQVICTSGITCASGGGQALILEPSGVQSVNQNKTSIYVNKASGTGNLLDLQTGGSDALVIDNTGNATFSNTTTAAALNVTGTLQTNTITPTSALTIGATNQQITLQGDQSSQLSSKDSLSGYTTSVAFDNGIIDIKPAPTGNVNYYFENNNSITPGNYEICTMAGNCVGTGGSITGSGTAGDVAVFTGPGNIGNSSYLSEAGGAVNIAGNLNVGTTGSGTLTVGVANTVNGLIKIANSTNSNLITIQQAVAPSSAVTLSLPNTSGTFAVSAASPLVLNATTGALTCPSCLSSGGGSGVVSVDGLTGTLTVSDSTGSGTTVSINRAKADNGTTFGTASFNSTNFTDNGSGFINTIQNIATGSSPTFAGLLVQGASGVSIGSATNDGKLVLYDGTADGFTQTFSQATLTVASKNITIPNASGTLAVSASSNLSLSALGDVTISNSPTFTSSVSTPQLTNSGAININPTGALSLSSGGSNVLSLTSGSGNISIGANTINSATLSGGTLSGGTVSGGTVSGGTLTNTAVNGLNASAIAVGGTGALTVSSGGAGALTLTSGSTLAVTSSDFTLTTLGALSTTGAIQGTSFDANSAAGLTIGGTNATSITLGKSGVGTTVADLLTASNGLTVTTGAVNLTGTSGALALSGLGASSISTGANALTVTSSN